VGRLIAACLAIVLGVGFGSLAMIVHSSASHGVDETIGAQYKGVDAVVYPGQASLSPADIANVQKLPQAASVVTLTTAYMQVSYPDLVRPTTLPIDALYDTTRIAGPGTSSGRLPTTTNEIALPARTAAKHKVTVGQTLRSARTRTSPGTSLSSGSWTTRSTSVRRPRSRPRPP
jgi:putative ABC transport system permease protein